MINCVIIEDEPLAQKGLINLIQPYAQFDIIKVCDDVEEFIQFREHTTQAIDLLFLDIELPGISGINFLRDEQPNIPVVLTTAYNQYALEGYELNVLDYLLKPISKERFNQTSKKAETYLHYVNSRSDDKPDFIYIKADKVLEKVQLDEIIMLEAMRNYVIYHCEKRKLISYNSLKNAEQNLPAEQFIKVQKSFIVNKHKVDKIEKGQVFLASRIISLNRENRSEIIRRLTEHTQGKM